MPNPSDPRAARLRALKRSLAAVAAGALVAAAPASAEPVKAGPAVPDELAVLATGGVVTAPQSNRSDQAAVHRFATADGGYRGQIAFPAAAGEGVSPITLSGQYVGSPLRQSSLERSVDGRTLTFAGIKAAANLNYQEPSLSTAVSIAADRTYTDTPFGSGYMATIGQLPVGAVTVDGSRFWTGITNNQKPLATIASGETALTQISGTLSSVYTVDIVDNALYATTPLGVFRLAGLPTAADTVTLPQSVIPVTGATDSVFVDADGAPGVDTAYVTRNGGLNKYVLEAGAWQARGSADGSFGWLTARAVAGAIEIYATNRTNTQVLKLVDTAELGAALTTTGVTTLTYAPARVRYTGIAFAPGSGFPSDPTPFPATPPAIYNAPTGTIDTHVGANPKRSVDIDIFDPTTPASELTVTATAANTTVLPADRITVTGTGTRRTITLDPIGTGLATIQVTVKDGTEETTVAFNVRASGPPPHPDGHYYSGAVDLSASIDVGGDYFLGMSDEVNTAHLYKKGVSGSPLESFNSGFPGGESDFEGVTRFGDTILWSASHGNNRSGSARPERRFLAFTKVTGSGRSTQLTFSHSYTRLWDQWKAWDAGNGHGLGANKLKFNTATVPGLIPNAPAGFNVEGLTMAPGSTTEAWFGMRAPTITGDDGIERALILPVTNIDKLTTNTVNAEFGAPIFLDLGGRSIRDISKNANDQYLILAGTGDTDDSLKNWAVYIWDGNRANAPQFVNELPTNENEIGAWEGIAEVPTPLVPGSRALLTADSGDTGIGKSYGQYVTIGQPVAGPAAVTGIAATAKPGAVDINWNAAEGVTRYFVTVKNPAGQNAPGTPLFATGTSASVENLVAGTEYTVNVRAENVATRSANGTPAKVTPTVGARTVTTTSVEFVGARVGGEAMKLVATVSDPGATGTIQFFSGNQTLTDAVALEPVPGCACNQYKRTFQVVDGKAEIDISHLSPGLLNFRARYTTTNPENFLSSDSPVNPTFIDHRPRVPRLEIVSITGERVAGAPITIKAKMHGYKPSELYPDLRIGFYTKIDGSNNKVSVINGEGSTDAALDEDGNATFTTTSLIPGVANRIGASVPNFNGRYVYSHTSEYPVKIAPEGSPAIEAPEVKQPVVAVTVEGTGIQTAPMTLKARISDRSLKGNVQFFHSHEPTIGPLVPVVDGVATYTGVVPSGLPAIFARFIPTENTDRVASSVSMAVPVLRGTTEFPLEPAVATATTLAITGDRVVGSPLTAGITVAAQSIDPLAARQINGYIELLNKGAEVAIAPVVAGKATVDLSGLGAGAHQLQARYVASDVRRSTGSESATEAVTVIAKTDVETPVGGAVPATLAVTLGAPATFGTFTPGVERSYDASMTATVVSTAGDAALTVADRSSTATGHLVNGAFSLPQALLVRSGADAFAPIGSGATIKTYGAPVANDVATVDFRQPIAASDALRTGQYSKTLTFTLSTTTP